MLPSGLDLVMPTALGAVGYEHTLTKVIGIWSHETGINSSVGLMTCVGKLDT